MDEITTLISNVGFPIAAFCAMYYMCNTTLKENTKAVSDCTELIREIMSLRKEEKDAS
jgi:hypothetical protein